MVLDALRDALLHLVRNAVDHGIERPDVRAKAGKRRAGTIAVTASLAGEEGIVQVSDDGAGLDLASLAARLAERGIAPPGSPREAMTLLLAGGISTRRSTTSVSGRGVGLDAVRDAVRRVRGTVEVRTEAGKGTTFVLRCPLSLTTVRGVLVKVGTDALVLPTSNVVRFLRVRAEDIREVEGRKVLRTDEGPVPVALLGEALGPPLAQRPPDCVAKAALLRGSLGRIAVVVDDFLSELELVVAPLGSTRWNPRYANGAVRLGTGRAAALVDVEALVHTLTEGAGGRGEVVAPALQGARRRARILVVDDSITTRALVHHILEAEGYDVVPAANGVEAWSLLGELGADAVVTDLDMPRMNGFDLCARIRDSRSFKDLPVVLVTALEREEERLRGMEAGADAYLGKSTFDQRTLIETVRQLLD